MKSNSNNNNNNDDDDDENSDNRRRQRHHQRHHHHHHHHSQRQHQLNSSSSSKSKCCFQLFNCLNLNKKNSVDIEQPQAASSSNLQQQQQQAAVTFNLSNSNNSLNSNNSSNKSAKAGTNLLRTPTGSQKSLQLLPTPTQQAQLENILDNLYSEKLKPTVDNLELGDDIEMADGDGTVKLSPRMVKSAMLIQRWYRRYLSRIELRKQTAWNIYQTIEYSGQQDQLKLYDFFLKLIKNSALINETKNKLKAVEVGASQLSIKSVTSTVLPADAADEEAQQLASEGEKTMKKANIVQRVFSNDATKQPPESDSKSPLTSTTKLNIEASYKGIELVFPISRENYYQLIEGFQNKKPLHGLYVIKVLEETIKQLRKMKNINYISTSITKQITVVGDLHGQLEDLLMIFYKNGLPSEQNPYLFNGDFVDRGPCSIEVVMIIFCGFLMSPISTYMNRGNHEDHVMNLRYGFLKEICDKYEYHSKVISNLFNEVFSWLPLASIIDQKTYVVHGGISDRTLTRDLSKIRREKYVSILKPPVFNENFEIVENMNMDELFEWRMVLDALWSDPQKKPGIVANSFRGGGCCFGPNITKEIMKRNNLDLIIRSHECKEYGYEYTHDNKVLTIFSASNYYESGSNYGAYLKLIPQMGPIIEQFQIKSGNILKNLTSREKVNAIEVSAIRHLLEKFAANKQRLLQAYKAKDQYGAGVITLNEWCTLTTQILDLKLPWRVLRPKLVKTNNVGLILYESTFQGLSLPSITQSVTDTSFTETLYRHRDVLESIFRAIDRDHSGQISKEEFRDACYLINEHDPANVFSEESIEDLANTMDINKDGFINLNEFMEAFRLVSNKF